MRKPFQLLLIEDDIDDVDLLKEALDENGVSYNMHVVMEADKLFTYLESLPDLPSTIILDLNLPKFDGKQLLKDIKAEPVFCNIPVVVLTTSSFKDDIDYCTNMGVRKYLTKPATINGWRHIIESIVEVASGSNNEN